MRYYTTMSHLHLALIGSLGMAAMPVAAADTGHELELKTRAAYWNNDEFKNAGNTSNKSEQSALGAQINYKSPFYAR